MLVLLFVTQNDPTAMISSSVKTEWIDLKVKDYGMYITVFSYFQNLLRPQKRMLIKVTICYMWCRMRYAIFAAAEIWSWFESNSVSDK